MKIKKHVNNLEVLGYLDNTVETMVTVDLCDNQKKNILASQWTVP